MAVSEMKKLSAVVMKDDTERLIAALQKLCCVEISETDTSDGALAPTDTKEASEAVSYTHLYIRTLVLSMANKTKAAKVLENFMRREYNIVNADVVQWQNFSFPS